MAVLATSPVLATVRAFMTGSTMPASAAQGQRQFTEYGPSHWAVLALFAAGAVLLVRAGRAHRDLPGAVRFRRGFALLIVAVQLPLQIVVLLPGVFNVTYSLPLQLCDLAWLTAVVALWTARRWACGLTYYWGLTLTSQAFLTPELAAPDFPSREYVMFWAMHCFIVWAAIYLTWGLGIRPDWRSYRTAVVCTGGWAVAMLGFNSLTGSNYGFLDRKPSGRSLLDALGPWPWYLLAELVIALAVWALITWPWTAGSTRRVADRPTEQPRAA